MKNQHTELINKYLSGSLSTQEVEDLKEWLKEDKQNQRELDKIKRTWMPNAEENEDLSQATKELRYKLNLKKSLNDNFKKTLSPKRKLFLNALKIAAIFIGGILFTQTIQTIGLLTSNGAEYCMVNADRGQKSRVTLPDGTEVWLNSESKIKFLAQGFDSKRYVELDGEAYFDVKRNEKVPFVVKTKSYDVEVLGTQFNVMAYEDMGRTETILIKGKVNIKQGHKETILKPGQKATFEANKLTVSKADVDVASSWKSNELRYDAISFQELVFSLERWFDVQIQINDPRLYDVVYSGVFKNGESFTEVMDALKYTTSINYSSIGFKKYEITFED